MLPPATLGVVEADRGGDQQRDQAADEDLRLDRAEAAGRAADRDRVDVDDERGADRDRRPRSR